MYIPYRWLSVSPQPVLLCGFVPVFFRLSEPGGSCCIISLPDAYTFQSGRSVSVPVGTDFELDYKGTLSEIQLGRQFVVRDA
jgi:hypothetical protein